VAEFWKVRASTRRSSASVRSAGGSLSALPPGLLAGLRSGTLQQRLPRRRSSQSAPCEASDFQHVLLTEYAAGAGIGWHKDKPMFADVVGISLGSPCVFRFRRKAGPTWERASVVAEPRSAYLLQGPSRTEWEHSIPAVDSLRYSITFRNLKPSHQFER
jgi:alkylated DNA repair dioxygenase AlkB